MKDGLTTSLTGECQPSRTSPATACSTFMPRVGTTVIFMAPVSISTSMTPSCRPPCSVFVVTVKGVALFTPSDLLVMV